MTSAAPGTGSGAVLWRRVIPDGVDDLRQPGSAQLRLVLPAAVQTQLSGLQGGRQESPPDELHQPVGHLLDHFLGRGIDSDVWFAIEAASVRE